MQCGCIAWDQREIPPCILINTRRRSISSSSIVTTFVIKDKEIAHLWCLQSSHYWWIQLLGKEACLFSVNVSRTDRNTKRQADCWPRQRTIVPYETRLGQNSRLVRRLQMPVHILLPYASSSWMTSVSLKQKNPDAIAMPLTHFLINGKEVAGQVKVGCGLQNVQTLSKKISMHFIGVVLNLKHSCDSPQKNP